MHCNVRTEDVLLSGIIERPESVRSMTRVALLLLRGQNPNDVLLARVRLRDFFSSTIVNMLEYRTSLWMQKETHC